MSIKKLLLMFTSLASLIAVLPAIAEGENPAEATTQEAAPAPEKHYGKGIDAKVNDTKCLMCHKKENNNGIMLGFHSSGEGKTKSIKCQSCHKGKNHPKENDVISFMPGSANTVQEQNKPCKMCHKLDKLVAKDFTHNSHNDRVACASCHKLHPVKDPIKGLAGKKRSELCVRCHKVEK